MTVDEILESAAKLISEKGWTQHQMFKLDGGMCAVGAIYRAAGVYGEDLHYVVGNDGRYVGDVARDALSRHVTGHTDYGTTVPRWNDKPERSAEDVILALKHAADNYRNEKAA